LPQETRCSRLINWLQVRVLPKAFKMSICKYCKRNFHDKHRPNAKQCRSCEVAKRRHKKKLKYVEHMGGKCEICGYNEDIAALQFHHVGEKKFSVNSSKLLLNEQTVFDELKNCQLLCANCHARVHSKYERFQ